MIGDPDEVTNANLIELIKELQENPATRSSEVAHSKMRPP